MLSCKLNKNSIYFLYDLVSKPKYVPSLSLHLTSIVIFFVMEMSFGTQLHGSVRGDKNYNQSRN